LAYEMKDGQGSLFRNDKKTGDKSPDYTGKIKWNGKEYRLAGWLKEGRTGKFLSVQMSEPRQKEAPKDAGTGHVDLNDSVPFMVPRD